MLFTMVKLSEILSGFVLLQAVQMEETSPCGDKEMGIYQKYFISMFHLIIKLCFGTEAL